MDKPPSTDPDLELFFAADREVPALPPASMQRMLGRIESVAATSAAAAAVPAITGLTAKAAVILGVASFTIGAATGGGLVWSMTPGEDRGPAEAVSVADPPPEEAPVPVATEPELDEPDDAPTPALVMRENPVPQERQNESEPSTLAAERRLLQAARAALTRGRPENATSVLARHRRRFPRGELLEERAILEIEAAFASRSWTQVEVLARRFSAEHPGSLYRSRVDRFRRQARTQAAQE